MAVDLAGDKVSAAGSDLEWECPEWAGPALVLLAAEGASVEARVLVDLLLVLADLADALKAGRKVDLVLAVLTVVAKVATALTMDRVVAVTVVRIADHLEATATAARKTKRSSKNSTPHAQRQEASRAAS